MRFIPKLGYIIAEVVYSISISEIKSDNGCYYSIDIGMDNLAAITINAGHRVYIINGRKLDMLIADFPDTYKLTGKDEVSKTYSFPKSYVSYHKPRAVSIGQRERAMQMIGQNKGIK